MKVEKIETITNLFVDFIVATCNKDAYIICDKLYYWQDRYNMLDRKITNRLNELRLTTEEIETIKNNVLKNEAFKNLNNNFYTYWSNQIEERCKKETRKSLIKNNKIFIKNMLTKYTKCSIFIDR